MMAHTFAEWSIHKIIVMLSYVTLMGLRLVKAIPRNEYGVLQPITRFNNRVKPKIIPSRAGLS
jgi:hypothetical protein